MQKKFKSIYMYLKRHQIGRCWISGKPLTGIYHRGFQVPIEGHHRFHDTDVNRRLCPLFIDSMLNIVLVLKTEHEMNRSAGIISYPEAEKWERFLQRHPKCANFVNGGFNYWEIEELDNPISGA